MDVSETSMGYRGWRVVLASLIGLAVSPGPLVFGSLGIIAGAFEAQYGWQRGDIMLSLTLFNLSTILAAPFIGQLIDRFGARRILILFISFFGIALAMPSFGLVGLYHFYAILFVAGAFSPGAQSMPYTRLITSWFDHNRGLAIGIAASGLGVGYAIAPPLVDYTVANYGWKMAFAFLGGSLAIPLFFVLLFARPRPGEEHRQSASSLPGIPARQAAGTASFWIIFTTILLFSCLLTGFVPHIVPLLKGTGMTGRQAAQYAAAFGVATFVGRVLVGFLLDRFFAPRVARVFFAIALLGFALLLILLRTTDMPLLLMPAVMMVGLGFGAESDLIAFFVSRYFGLRAFGQIYGYILSAFILGAAIGPIALGYGYDYFGQYDEVLVSFILIGFFGLWLLGRLGPYAYPVTPQPQPQPQSQSL